MSLDFNELIQSFTKANIEFSDIYLITIPPGGKSLNSTTSPGVCGIVIPVKGKARFIIDKWPVELERGVILHAGSGMELYKEVLGNSEWEFILLHYKIAGDENIKKYLETKNFILNISAGGSLELDLLLQRLLRLEKESVPMKSLKCKALLYAILEELLQSARETMLDSKEESIEFLIDYIQDNLDKSLTVFQLAEKVGMDSRQLHYLFLKRMGISPKKYLIRCKIKRAKELLENENYSISRISDMVGYEDPLHFSRIFKKNMGISPNLYRSNFEKNPWRI
ncbi:AraC family transcriptional regulator [Mobilisporobacter senegalensis]|uniref:AraC family transcriptional regulator n=1 Tax=Mobilisporobacter senegalensis TaxID=1329262 RepID=A0A3N1XV22_9FIRM|nr:AraC family transcriptional regulator [Mobilisporobacter senegalensis]ROR30463.1 AraC family transcriptional regulator [Mobilisporobacter senegalensis]